MGIAIGIFFVLISYPWGAMHSDLGHLLANEKLTGELLGVVVAVLAIGLFKLLEKRARSTQA